MAGNIAVAVMVAVAWTSLPMPTHAQIASEIDGGKVVYVNGGSPKIHRGGTISSPSSPSRLSSGGKTGASAVGSLNTASEESDPRLDRIVNQAAERHQLDPALVKAVISTESGWNPYAVSRKGAMGLMQLIPATAERYGVGNPYDPAQNIEGGATYLRWLLDRYNGDLTKSLAAYNAGEHAVDESGGVPWYPETRRYVQKVTNAYFQSDSDHDPTLLSPPKAPVRKDVQPDGRVVFTNE